MKSILIETEVEHIPSIENFSKCKISILTTKGKEFRISFDNIDDSILIKEVSGETLTINAIASNFIRIS